METPPVASEEAGARLPFGHWDEDTLKRALRAAHQRWAASQLDATSDYATVAQQARRDAARVLAQTRNGRDLGQLQNRSDFDVLRFAADPPISNDRLAALVDGDVLGDIGRGDVRLARATVLDHLLSGTPWLPWRRSGALASTAELRSALDRLSDRVAQQRWDTQARTQLSARQEQQLYDLLSRAGYEEVDAPRRFDDFTVLPPGTFCRERTVAGKKADAVARPLYGPVLLFEAKHCGDATNSVKRVGHEVLSKHRVWRETYGDAARTVAIVGGVLSPKPILELMPRQVPVVFDHDLGALGRYLSQVHDTPPT